MPITNVKVKLVGTDGNAFAIIGRVMQAMRRAKVEYSIIEAYKKEALSGDYDKLLETTMKYVEVL